MCCLVSCSGALKLRGVATTTAVTPPAPGEKYTQSISSSVDQRREESHTCGASSATSRRLGTLVMCVLSLSLSVCVCMYLHVCAPAPCRSSDAGRIAIDDINIVLRELFAMCTHR